MFPFCADVEIFNPSNPHPPAPTLPQGTSRPLQPPAEKTHGGEKMRPHGSLRVPDRPVAERGQGN